MIKLDLQTLENFESGEGLLNIKSNIEANDLLSCAIFETVHQKQHPDSPFNGTNIGWEPGLYRVVGWLKNDAGGYCLKFNRDLTKVGFESDYTFNEFSPIPDVKDLLNKIIIHINKQAFAIESLIIKKYLEEVRYGTMEDLIEEWDKVSKEICETMSKGRNAPIQKAFPLNLNPDGDIIKYIKSHHVDADNVHVIIQHI